MSSKEVINRLVANMSGVEHEKIQRKKVLTDNEKESIENALEKIKSFNLQIYDKGSLTVDHLFNLAKKLHKQNLLDLLVIDYLQLMNSGRKSQNDHSDLGYITRRLKQLAQEIYIPILALSQLNRASADKNGKIREPQLTDLRQSGSIEEDANFVLMLHHEDDEEKFKEKHIKLFVRKNRSGAMGTIYMNYIGDLVRFEEMVWNDKVKKFEKVKQEVWSKEFDIHDDDLPF